MTASLLAPRRIGPGTVLLFVPGNRPDRFAKAAAAGADGIIIDLEDAVAPDDKAQARQLVLDWLATDEANASSCLKGVRVNRVLTPHGLSDLHALVAAATLPDFLILPKVESPFEVRLYDELLGTARKGIELVLSIESALGLQHAPAIATASPTVSMLGFGGGDLALNLQAKVAWEPLLYARSRMVEAAAAAGVVAADVPWPNMDDEAGLREEAKRAYELGYRSKLAIHPKQVAAIREAMAPTDAEIQWARRAVAAYETSTGACVVDGRFVDQPVYEPAKRLVDAVDSKRN